jgi:prepilin-type N-terminal cleavage/methylation domain-containing protein
MIPKKSKFAGRNLRAGFTLTELVVAMGVFLVVMTVAVGGFVRALKTQRFVNHLMEVNSNASIILEQMARELRGGYSATTTSSASPSCPPGQNDILEFTNSKNNKVTYTARGFAILKQECAGSDCSNSSFEPLTAPNLAVQRLCFIKVQPQSNDPWRITFLMKIGSFNPELQGSVINLQTTVSLRILPADLQ